MTNQKAMDTPSHKGCFGWEGLGADGFAVPVIVRTNGVRYCPTRIVEQEIIKKYMNLPQNVFTCITLKSFYLTGVEARLLNEINISHCNQRYGAEFFSTSDVIISAADIRGLSRYLNLAKEIFSKNVKAIGPHYGLIKIAPDPLNQEATILIPYIEKSFDDETMRFVPSKLVENFAATTHSVKGKPTDWDVMYLRLLCVYADNNTQQEITKDGCLISLPGLVYAKTQAPIISQDCDQ